MEHKTCLICNSQNLKTLGNYQKAFLCQCKNCDFIFSVRIPTNEELEKHYDGYGRNDYLSPITVKRYHEILDSFEPYRKTNKIIDVGCGIGYFLVEAKKRGWEVYGSEFTETAIKINEEKGIKMEKGELNMSNYEIASFDIITSFEVLEHINNPQEEINKFFQLLRKGGLLYFTTPNFNSIERYYLRENYTNICYPEHLSYYTKRTMNKLLTEIGFVKKRIFTYGISVTIIKNSKFAANEKQVSEGNTDDKIRNMTEGSIFGSYIKKNINYFLNLFSIGNSLKGYYIKA